MTLFGAGLTVAFLSVQQPAAAIDGPCRASWCQAGATVAAAQRLVDEQVAELTAGRDCWTPGTRREIPATVLVRGEKVNKSVVWAVSLDKAFALNKDGDPWNNVFVIEACAATYHGASVEH